MRGIFIAFGNQDFTHAVIACNTAHLLLDQIRALLPRANFISLIDLASDFIIDMNVKNLGILASPNTINSKLHQRLFQELNVLTLDSTGMDSTSSIISGVIKGNLEQSILLKKQIDALILRGSSLVLLGCTELSVINNKEHFTRVVDPIDLAVKEIMKR